MRRTSYLDPRVDSRATIFSYGVFSFSSVHTGACMRACVRPRVFLRGRSRMQHRYITSYGRNETKGNETSKIENVSDLIGKK